MYKKELFVFDQHRPQRARIRNYGVNDFAALIDIQRECFPPPFPSELWWNEEQLANHISLFPEGAHLIEVEGDPAGSITGLIIDWSMDDTDHAWAEITDSGYIRNHKPDGNTLYIVDISVRPRYRKLGLGKLLMHSMYDVVVAHRLARLLGGARMPGYHAVAAAMSPEAYLQKVVSGEIADPIVTFLMRCGRTPVRIAREYLDDVESGNNAVLMEWRNPFLNNASDAQ
ncbi:MAG TPA: GNAT family N-acetyltransferase [Candidatus Hydrogenedentes bacterium]|nr:GNAT family N-acetyltransferase [Candidatus Hydrogenedentota bacterium]